MPPLCRLRRITFLLPLLLASSVVGADDGTWFEPSPPVGRYFHGLVHDAARNRLVMITGSDPSRRDDGWALELGSLAWSKLSTAGTPPSTSLAATLHDPLRDRLVQFGGVRDSLPAVTYPRSVRYLTLSNPPTWTTAGYSNPPPGRTEHAVAYDSVRDQMLVYGGQASGGVLFGDLWTLPFGGSAWTQIVPTGPSPGTLIAPAMVYDSARDRLLVLGGHDGTSPRALDRIWELSLSGSPMWNELVVDGLVPELRGSEVVRYDPVGDRVIMFAGSGNSGALSDVWELVLGDELAWHPILPAGAAPAGRYWSAGVIDPIGPRMLVFGGRDGLTTYGDTWELDLGAAPAWTQLVPGRLSPPNRQYQTVGFDRGRDRLVLFGGLEPNFPAFGDLWVLESPYAGDWAPLASSGTPPAGRSRHSAIVDPVRERMIVHGGLRGGSTFSDTWSLSLTGEPAWTQVVLAGPSPGPRRSHTAIYDPVNDRMVVFGGSASSGGARLNDVWALSLTPPETWTQLLPSGSPPPGMNAHSAFYDPVGQQMIVGAEDIWALSLSGPPQWTMLPGGPEALGMDAVYDPGAHRALLFGGSTYAEQVWEMDLASNQWRVLAPAGDVLKRIQGISMVWDDELQRMIVFGGYNSGTRNDVVWLQFPPPLDVDGASEARSMLSGSLRPNPASGEVTIEFRLAAAAPVVVRVYDLLGRERRVVARGAHGAGTHRLSWDARDKAGARVAPGVYLCSIESGGSRWTKRLVVTR